MGCFFADDFDIDTVADDFEPRGAQGGSEGETGGKGKKENRRMVAQERKGGEEHGLHYIHHTHLAYLWWPMQDLHCQSFKCLENILIQSNLHTQPSLKLTYSTVLYIELAPLSSYIGKIRIQQQS